ncbi:uncharacterized protein LOC127581899 [Pristis pectinata]|uniref:uncharacterized protein LOC127581899 n=1 Tax=Pristis pectinata TaxID=685728 RepID=UPI00223CFBD5|nr:uncharacterized protein LOC127581899 [Pristis pectinata]
MCSLPCGNKLCSKMMESPTGHRHYAQSNNLTGDPRATVSADTRHVSSSLTSDENEDLDDSLLELEEKEGDGEDLMNLTSEEIDKILQESDDNIVDNSDSFKLGDVSGIGDDALGEHKYSDISCFSLSPPSTSQLPKNYLVTDELETSYLGNDLTADVSVLKVDKEVNQSVKSEQHNHNSVHENTEIEKPEQPYYISVDKVAVINPMQNGADVETDERDHIPSSNEAGPETQDKMLIAVSPGTSSNMLKEDNKSILLEQNISEEKTDRGRVKEHTTIPGSREDEVPDLKAVSEHKQSVAESPKEKGQQKFKPAKQAEHIQKQDRNKIWKHEAVKF